jgi:hypothetical protein
LGKNFPRVVLDPVREEFGQKLPGGKRGEPAGGGLLYDFSQVRKRKESQQRIIERLPYLLLLFASLPWTL